MWHLAAESLRSFPEVVVTALGRDGYPVSVRERSSRYDGSTGEMPISVPEFTALAVGPANLIAHYHDEELWNLRMVQIKGLLEKRSEEWVFVSTVFTPPARGQLTSLRHMAKSMRRSSRRYLATRGLKQPKVNWAALKRLRQQEEFDRRNRCLPHHGRNT